MKRMLFPVLRIVLSLAIALVLGEVAVRALYKQQTVLFPRYHTDYHYGPYTLRGVRPNAEFWHTSADGSWKFVTNSRGLRDSRDFPYEKPAGTLRVLGLGDSQAQGYEVGQADTYAAVLERYLAQHGVKAEVLNAGVSGFSTAEALAFLENEGHKYRPDVVVLGFTASDFQDNLKAGLFALEDGKLVAHKYEHVPGVRIQNALYAVPGLRWLSENSYAYSVVFNGVWQYFKRALHERALRQSGATPADVPDFEYALPVSDSLSDYEVSLAMALLGRMQRFCEERGMRLIVVEVPRPDGSYGLIEPLPAAAAQELRAAKLELVRSRELLGAFEGAARMHLSRGHRHISELTHALIGVDLGQRILRSATGPTARARQ